MNIPFRFTLQTSTTPYGRLFEYTAAASGYDMNNTLYSISQNAGLTGSASTKLAAVGITIPSSTLWVVGFSLMAWYTADVGVKVDVGLYNVSGSSFIPLYECVATGVNAGGIQKSLSKYETGFLMPVTSNLLPVVKVSKQTATDGSVTVSGDIAVLPIPA